MSRLWPKSARLLTSSQINKSPHLPVQDLPVTYPEEFPDVRPQGDRLRIGILGGTFNPPHLGHLLMGDQVGHQLHLDEVWFMPTAQPPHAEGKTTISADHRLAMTRLAIADNPLFKIQTYEIDQGGINYTARTMRYFTHAYPECDFFFIMGTDSANSLHTWQEPETLVEMMTLVGVHRPGEWPYTGPYPILWVDSPMIDLGSTEIRLRVYLEQSIRYQVPEEVEAYIYKHGLYRD